MKRILEPYIDILKEGDLLFFEGDCNREFIPISKSEIGNTVGTYCVYAREESFFRYLEQGEILLPTDERIEARLGDHNISLHWVLVGSGAGYPHSGDRPVRRKV